jgi:hypothetical protein
MKKLFIAIVFVVAIPLNLFAQEQANKPDYKDGDFWQYKVTEKGFRQQSTTALNGVYELTYKPDRIAIRLEGGEKSEVRQAVGELRRMLAVDDDRQLLQFPLSIGKKWSTRFEQATSSSAARKLTTETNVTGLEEITTPAGKFRAFKIERWGSAAAVKNAGKAPGSKTRNYEWTYYYSPQTQSIVKYVYEDEEGGTREIELVKFTAKKPE